jgi:dTDP-4-dehydrorhamnose reductase
MKNILIIGSNGLLGQSLVRKFNQHFEITGCSLEKENYNPIYSLKEYFQLNINVRSEIRNFFSKHHPDIIINAAAFTNVDKCEEERKLCWQTNVKSIEYILEVCESFSPVFVQISSDYIFNGNSGSYQETDQPNPLGYYGFCKLAAEKVFRSCGLEYLIARTEILYGVGNKIRPNFVTWVIDELKKGKKIRVVNDQYGNPTFVDDLSEAIYLLLEREAYGIFHVSGRESCSRYDFALKIARIFELNNELIQEITSEELNQKASRPMNSSFVLYKLSNAIDWIPSNVEGGLNRLKEQINAG